MKLFTKRKKYTNTITKDSITNPITGKPLTTDIHSHFLPGIDDGVSSLEESVAVIREMQQLGYNRAITTPHVMGDFYPNTPEIIHQKLEEVNNELQRQNIEFSLSAAAEYYLDEFFMAKLEDPNEKLLTFGDNYLLFETSYMNEPRFLKEAIFALRAAGYKPVMAHPERYIYFYDNEALLQDLISREVFMQVNLLSIDGYYSVPAKKLAEKLIKQKQVSFLGTDCHNLKHLRHLKLARKRKMYAKALELPLLNHNI